MKISWRMGRAKHDNDRITDYSLLMTASAKCERHSPVPIVILVCVAVLPDRLSVDMASFRHRFHAHMLMVMVLELDVDVDGEWKPSVVAGDRPALPPPGSCRHYFC